MKRIFMSLLLALPFMAQAEQSSNDWKDAIEKSSNSIVSIRVNAVRPFDTERSKVTQATGFVVDAEQVIILTNRHVVQPGPITAEAVFSNSEEVKLVPIYRDPVHDFGFFRYTPSALKFIKPKALELTDKTAIVGDEIKVIGNDSGEQMSILSGTLARLDRSAPRYARGGYNDFNTFYYQSSVDTSGGSSGAPVINRKGKVIALNAGANNRASSSFFLPLYKVTKALESIQNNQTVERGTIQATLVYQTYDEVRRLGLSNELEQQFRKKGNGRGLLVVRKTVRSGPAYDKLRPGDIIVSLSSSNKQSKLISRYENFEFFLDQHVGQSVVLTVYRQNKTLDIELVVDDLHRITPSEYLQISDAILNNFSYQLARQTNLSTDGIFISTPGFMFANAGLGRGAVIRKINDQLVSNLSDAESIFSGLKQGEYFSVGYVSIGDPKTQRVANVKFETNWHHSSYCTRDDQTGIWPCRSLVWSA
jgi:S1-C subfamily serine protease